MRSAHELRVRIQNVYDLGDRLVRVNYLQRLWLADYAADADLLADCMLELLNGNALLPQPDPDPNCEVCTAP